MILSIELKQIMTEADQVIDSCDVNKIQVCIDSVKKIIPSIIDNQELVRYYYYIISNLYSSLIDLSKDHSEKNINKIEALNNIRKAYNPKQNLIQDLQTNENMANLLMLYKRRVEELGLRNADFSLIDKFPGLDSPFVSSWWSIFTFYHLSHFMDDINCERSDFISNAYWNIENLILNVDKCPHPKIKQNIIALISAINNKDESFLISNDLKIAYGILIKSRDVYSNIDPDLRYRFITENTIYIKGKIPRYRKRKLDYHKWCLDNRLFLNYRNLTSTNWVADSDNLIFPTYITNISKKYPEISIAFSMLKREFCFARHMLYEGLKHAHPKYENNYKSLMLSNYYDSMTYDGNIEKIKTSFRMCFGILDKLATLMNEYFELNSEDPVYFKPNFIKKLIKSKKLESNEFLEAIMWLSYDLADKENHEVPSAYAAKIRTIRNFLEHKFIKVCEFDVLDKNNESFINEIIVEDLTEWTFNVFKLVRSALFYFCFAVSYNEKEKLKESNKPTISMYIPFYKGDLC